MGAEISKTAMPFAVLTGHTQDIMIIVIITQTTAMCRALFAMPDIFLY